MMIVGAYIAPIRH